jgi:hypothetical protein
MTTTARETITAVARRQTGGQEKLMTRAESSCALQAVGLTRRSVGILWPVEIRPKPFLRDAGRGFDRENVLAWQSVSLEPLTNRRLTFVDQPAERRL